MRRGAKSKAVNDPRDLGGRNKLDIALEAATKLEQDYDNAVNDKPEFENQRAMELLNQAINQLSAVTNEV
jgi:hypothetical protein